MSKIVSAVNAMISNIDKVSEVRTGTDKKELFFCYDGKYNWSISHNEKEDVYYLFYYPGDYTTAQLAALSAGDWQTLQYLAYNTEELKTREAKESFAELYTTMSEKMYSVDDVLDDIISDMQT
ncbi:MAG: hypothetical protein M1133_10625 [Armatimonadetes bacterium]|nr:hypothetical protein [Armatimonadota bacterium]